MSSASLRKPPTCEVCLSAVGWHPSPIQSNDIRDQIPRWNKNRRRNTSGILRYMHSDGRMRNILVDCGKTFMESALQWFVTYRLRNIDAVILTHGHADAMMGLDDLRQWTLDGTVQVRTRKRWKFDRVGDNVMPFFIEELEVAPFEVEHGKYSDQTPYMCMGFRFGDFTYISDASAIPERAWNIIEGTQVLVIDALKGAIFSTAEEMHASHFGIPQATDVCLRLKPMRAYYIGFSHRVDHDSLFERLENDKGLKQAGIKAEPGYDGQRIDLTFLYSI
ncbi:beta-lactamase-like protein [Chytridium lagenaria]|nr:beta-lactamase-like protein [Chytridium lagenaria]